MNFIMADHGSHAGTANRINDPHTFQFYFGHEDYSSYLLGL